jgi:hypothetical protein
LARQPVAPAPVGSAFPHAGFYVLRGRHSHVVVHCGDVGQNGNGGHAHNDLLSFELSLGVPVIVDSGTYVYTSDPAARNRFRGTASHNTVVVAESEINPMMNEGLFRLKQVADPSVGVWEETSEGVHLVVSHDGYRRLATPVIHRREFTLDRMTDSLNIVDDLEGRGEANAQSYLHFAADTLLSSAADGNWISERRGTRCRVRFFGFDEVLQDEGWVSDRFGVRSPAPVLVGLIGGRLPRRFGYRIEPLAVTAHSNAAELARST